jgi:hypothetical protein
VEVFRDPAAILLADGVRGVGSHPLDCLPPAVEGLRFLERAIERMTAGALRFKGFASAFEVSVGAKRQGQGGEEKESHQRKSACELHTVSSRTRWRPGESTVNPSGDLSIPRVRASIT